MSSRLRLPVAAPESVDQAFGLAAPLLAGFCITLIGVLTQLPAADTVRWRDLDFLLFLTAAIFYLVALRLSLSTRALRVSNYAIEEHWSNGSADEVRALYSEAFEKRKESDEIFVEIANFFFLAATCVLLIPGDSAGEIGPLRWAAIVVGCRSVAMSIALPVLRRVRIAWLPRFIQQAISPNLSLIEQLREIENRQ